MNKTNNSDFFQIGSKSLDKKLTDKSSIQTDYIKTKYNANSLFDSFLDERNNGRKNNEKYKIEDDYYQLKTPTQKNSKNDSISNNLYSNSHSNDYQISTPSTLSTSSSQKTCMNSQSNHIIQNKYKNEDLKQKNINSAIHNCKQSKLLKNIEIFS